MAKLNQNLDDANNKVDTLRIKLEELKDKYEEVTLKSAPIVDPKDLKTAEDLKDAIGFMEKSIKNMKPDLQGLSDIFKNTVNELTTGDKLLTRQRQSLNKSSNLADRLLDIKKGETSLTSKEIGKLTSKLQLEKENLVYLARQKKLNGENYDDLTSQIGQLQSVIDESKKMKEIAIKTNSTLAGTPLILAGIDKGLQKLGLPSLGIQDAVEHTHKLNQEAEGTNGKVKTLQIFTKKLGQNINNALSPTILLQMTFAGILSLMKSMDASAGRLAKGMNMSYNQGVQLNQEFRDIANSSGDIMINQKGLEESLLAINKTMGTNAMLSDKTLNTFTKLRETAGLTNEELMGATQLSFANGKSLEDNVDAILKTTSSLNKANKVRINEKDVLKEINKLSAATTLSLGKNPEQLAAAVATAKRLGMEMSQLENISSSLLDFESSIENELKAELLIGRDLTLEKARQAALDNDMVTLAEEISREAGSAAEFTSMNRIQQEAMAKAVGMNREELANTLFIQEKIKGMSEEDAQKREELLQKRIKEVGLAQAMRESEGEGIDLLEQQASNAEKFGKVIEKIKETFAAIADGPLGTVLGMMGKLLQNSTAVYTIVGAIATIYTGKMLIGLGRTIIQAGVLLGITTAKAAAEMTALSALTLGLATAGVVGAVIAAMAGLSSLLTPADDMMSQPGYGKRTLFGPEGAIQLNDKDTVIAGTNLFGDDVIAQPNKPTEMGKKDSINIAPPPIVDMSSTNSKLDSILAAIERGSIIQFEGDKLGETVNLGARSI